MGRSDFVLDMEYRGIKVVENVHLVEEVQVKRHKKWRTNKKWKNRYGVRFEPRSDTLMLNGNMMVVHPETLKKIEKAWVEQEKYNK